MNVNRTFVSVVIPHVTPLQSQPLLPVRSLPCAGFAPGTSADIRSAAAWRGKPKGKTKNTKIPKYNHESLEEKEQNNNFVFECG